MTTRIASLTLRWKRRRSVRRRFILGISNAFWAFGQHRAKSDWKSFRNTLIGGAPRRIDRVGRSSRRRSKRNSPHSVRHGGGPSRRNSLLANFRPRACCDFPRRMKSHRFVPGPKSKGLSRVVTDRSVKSSSCGTVCFLMEASWHGQSTLSKTFHPGWQIPPQSP